MFLIGEIALADILTVGDGGDGYQYSTIEQAAEYAVPGDTIMVHTYVYQGGMTITGLKGNEDNYITIMAAPGAEAIISGGSSGIHFIDIAYVNIIGFKFRDQTGNGVNIDDGGSYDTPSHNIHIIDCQWLGMNATGNNDELKMSGVDVFTIKDCLFRDGSPGGSLIDMVGCHSGNIYHNEFINGGSNSIQAKGGSRNILITRNKFQNGGLRSINIGGSTGLEFFRPQGVSYEANRIIVLSNLFLHSQAPIAFVGATECHVENNTLIMPEKWAVRILQETTLPEFDPCGNNFFRNNIIYFNNAASAYSFNIGPNTAPETFTISNNLWYNIDNANWSGPNQPVNDPDMILNQDPLFKNFSEMDFSLQSNSPAIGNGWYDLSISSVRIDFIGNEFNRPPSIGAIEGNPPGTSSEDGKSRIMLIYPNPAADILSIDYSGNNGRIDYEIYNLIGKKLLRGKMVVGLNSVDIRNLSPGVYFIKFPGTKIKSKRLIKY